MTDNEKVIKTSRQKDEFKIQVLETFAALITAAFGLIAALAWNEAIKGLINKFFESGDGLMAMFVYAIVVTIIAVIFAILIANSIKKAKDKIPTEED